MVELKVEPNRSFFENYLQHKSKIPEYQKFYGYLLTFLETKIEPTTYASKTELKQALDGLKPFIERINRENKKNIKIPEKCMEKLVIEGDKIGFSPMRTDSCYEYRSGELIGLAYIKVLV